MSKLNALAAGIDLSKPTPRAIAQAEINEAWNRYNAALDAGNDNWASAYQDAIMVYMKRYQDRFGKVRGGSNPARRFESVR